MTPRIRHCLLAVVLLGLLGCQPRAPQFTAQDEAAIRGMFDAALGYVRSGDWATWAGMFAEDGMLQPPNAPTVTGRDGLLAWGQAFPPIESLTWPNVQARGEGNMAYGTSAYTLKLKDLPPDSGKQLAVFRRGATGGWEIVAVSYSSDLPPAAPAPARRPAKK